jgi:hypothetical protein
MLVGALHLLCGDNVEDVLQPLVHVTHPISGGCGQRVQKRSRHGHVLASPGKSGELPLSPVPQSDLLQASIHVGAGRPAWPQLSFVQRRTRLISVQLLI